MTRSSAAHGLPALRNLNYLSTIPTDTPHNTTTTMAPLSSVAVRRPVSPCFSTTTSSDAGSDVSDRSFLTEHEWDSVDDSADDGGIVEWQALLTSASPSSGSLFSETPETFVGVERQPAQPPPPPVCGGCVMWHYAAGERQLSTSTWTTPTAPPSALTAQHDAEPRVLMRLPANFQELGRSKEQWQEQWRLTYDAWKSDTGIANSSPSADGPTPMVAVAVVARPAALA